MQIPSARELPPIATLLLLVACSAGDPVAADTDPPLSNPETEDTGWPAGDEGSLMLVRRVSPDQPTNTMLVGVFLDSNYGRFQNLASCAILGGHCLDALPTDYDDFIDLGPEVLFAPELATFRYVGLDVALGPHKAHYVTDRAFPHYFSDLGAKLGGEELHGSLGVRFAGQWGPYEGDKDLRISGDIDLLLPMAGTRAKFNDQEHLAIEWVPNGEGEIYLTVTSKGAGTRIARMSRLLDDGFYRLSARELGLGSSDRDFEIRLARWNRTTIEVRGHTLDVIATSEVAFNASYQYTGGRDRVHLENRCMAAQGMLPLQPGNYWGELADAGFTNRLSEVGSCTGSSATGAEGFAKVVLEPLQFLTVAHTLLDDDASVYLVEDCARGNTCVAGSDSEIEGLTEYMSYFNDSDEAQTFYLGVDGYQTSKGIFYLDVGISTLAEPEMYNTCVDAMQQQTPTGSGTYYTSYLPYSNLLDPGAGGCTGTSVNGPDSMTLVTLQAGESIAATIQMPGGDPALYLLYNCNNAFSCAAGRDLSVGPSEALTYTNNSGLSENLYLVVDTKGPALRPYFLTIDIQ